jgi:hypothetical protein
VSGLQEIFQIPYKKAGGIVKDYFVSACHCVRHRARHASKARRAGREQGKAGGEETKYNLSDSSETKLDIRVALINMFRYFNAAVVTTVVGVGFKPTPPLFYFAAGDSVSSLPSGK